MHLEADWDSFYQKFRRMSGLDLYQYKPDQLRRRILSMVDTKGLPNLNAFADWLGASKSNVEWFQDKLAINVSELYRNPEKWRELEQKVLPELAQGMRGLRCWSAGCSYGAEAYTLASIFASSLPGRHTILGTDIDQAALDQARRAEFSEPDMRCVPPAIRDAYFTRHGEGWRANDKLRGYCTFREGNLLAEPTESDFDLILCRNVVIYFTDAAKDQLYERFFRALRPGGILFVGGTERIFKSRELGFECPWPFFYRKPMQGVRQWRNAS